MKYKALKQTVKKIIQNYQVKKRYVNVSHSDFKLSPTTIKEIKTIDQILKNHTFKESLIFKNDILTSCSYIWWDEYFSKSTYYRHARNAYESFLKEYKKMCKI